jgi:hypothetical protein
MIEKPTSVDFHPPCERSSWMIRCIFGLPGNVNDLFVGSWHGSMGTNAGKHNLTLQPTKTSFPNGSIGNPESLIFMTLISHWIPAFAGMTVRVGLESGMQT